MKLVGEELTSCVHSYRDIWLPARQIVERAIADRCQVTNEQFHILGSMSMQRLILVVP